MVVPNIHRKPNPFSLGEEDDWVSSPHPASGRRHGKVGDGPNPAKPPLPPRRRNEESPRPSLSVGEDDCGGLKSAHGRETSSIAGMPRDTVPPPIPRKPDLLSRKRNTGNSDSASVDVGRGNRATPGDLLDGGDEKIGWQSLVP